METRQQFIMDNTDIIDVKNVLEKIKNV